MAKLGANEIQTASESGGLEIYDFASPVERVVIDSERRAFVEEYVSVVGETVSNEATYALFDEETNSLISAGIIAGIIPVSELGIARGREVGLAVDLFSRLPLFPRRLSVKSSILDVN
jgi:hypothetical protein